MKFIFPLPPELQCRPDTSSIDGSKIYSTNFFRSLSRTSIPLFIYSSRVVNCSAGWWIGLKSDTKRIADSPPRQLIRSTRFYPNMEMNTHDNKLASTDSGIARPDEIGSPLICWQSLSYQSPSWTWVSSFTLDFSLLKQNLWISAKQSTKIQRKAYHWHTPHNTISNQTNQYNGANTTPPPTKALRPLPVHVMDDLKITIKSTDGARLQDSMIELHLHSCCKPDLQLCSSRWLPAPVFFFKDFT